MLQDFTDETVIDGDEEVDEGFVELEETVDPTVVELNIGEQPRSYPPQNHQQPVRLHVQHQKDHPEGPPLQYHPVQFLGRTQHGNI